MNTGELIVRGPRRRRIALIATLACVVIAGSCTSTEDRSSEAPDQRLPGTLRLVGHEPLFGRGMNTGLAVWHGYAYVGNRTDGSPGHPHAGVL